MDLQYFPCKADKRPAVEHWKEFRGDAASAVKGVVLPPCVVVIDIDSYKNGDVRNQIEQKFNCKPEWHDALLQYTPSGGNHYAFRASRDGLKQGQDILNIQGFDIRTGGKGYICTGMGYQVVGALGMNRLIYPETLPELPIEIERRLLPLQIVPNASTIPAAPSMIAEDEARRMLSHIKPDCNRELWVKVGMSMKASGLSLDLFYEWSCGMLTGGEVPYNFVPEDVETQFKSFKPVREGDSSIGPQTLRYIAREHGYREDWARVFAGGAAVGVGEFKRVAEQIMSSGADPLEIETIISEIRQAPLSEVERELAMTVLREEMKSAGIWSPGLKRAIENQVGLNTRKEAPQANPEDFRDLAETLGRVGVWDTGVKERPHVEELLSQASDRNHLHNAKMIIAAIFSSHLRRSYETNTFFFWSGNVWKPLDDQEMESIVWPSLAPAKCSEKHIIMGTMRALSYNVRKMDATINTRVIYFQDCVLDAERNQAYEHNIMNYNKGLLTTAYNPAAIAPQWIAFVESLFLGLEDGPQRIALLQEIMGYMLFEDNLGIEKCIALTGASRGGKGVIMKVLTAIIGKGNYGTTSFSKLWNHKQQVKFMRHTRIFDFDAKAPERSHIDEATEFFNKMVSNEEVSIEKMYIQGTHEPEFHNKLMINCNGTPRLIDDSGATSNRFILLKFDRSFYGHEDKTLKTRLTTPYELEGITAWCVEGATRLLRNGGNFTIPQSTLEEMEEMRDENQPLLPFIAECLNVGPENRVHTSELYAAYRLWAMERGVGVASQAMLTRALKQTLENRVKHKKAIRIGEVTKAGFIGISLSKAALSPSQLAFAGGSKCETEKQ